MTTDDILRNALHATAEASDRIVPGSGDHYRAFADERYAPKPSDLMCRTCRGKGQYAGLDITCRTCHGSGLEPSHTHHWQEIPVSERTDICRYACARYRCAECGEEQYA